MNPTRSTRLGATRDGRKLPTASAQRFRPSTSLGMAIADSIRPGRRISGLLSPGRTTAEQAAVKAIPRRAVEPR
jgi:hypothetical protein